MPEPEESQLGNRILSVVAGVLGVAQHVAPLVPVPLLAPTVTLLTMIITTVQGVGDNNDALNELQKTASSLILILVYWADKGLQNSPEIEKSIKRLHDSLQKISKHIERQAGLSTWKKILVNNYAQDLRSCQNALSAALTEFQIYSHVNINVELANMDAGIKERLSAMASSVDDKLSIIHVALLQIIPQLQSDIQMKKKRNSKTVTTLLENSAFGASHDSAARGDVPKCLDGTRKAIIQKFVKWLDDPEDTRALQWMYGPAGCGKTSIAQSIAEILEHAGYLAGSFFWSRSALNRPTSNEQFATTIAHQLCKSIPGFVDHVTSALEHDSALLNKTLSIQMAELVVKPLNRVSQDKLLPFGKWWLLLIDALDECSGNNHQAEVIEIIVETLVNLKFPLRILVCSRDEHAIRTALIHNAMTAPLLATPVDLASEGDTENDIRELIQSKLDQIKKTHPAHDDLPADWPTASKFKELVYRCAGLFIYADIVMQYIESPDNHPSLTLDEILRLPKPDEKLADEDLFRKLDEMYAFVLQKIPPKNVQHVHDLFAWLIFSNMLYLSLSMYDQLFDLVKGQAATLLSPLKSIVKIHDDQSLGFFHASCTDFLTDRERLQRRGLDRFYCNKQQAHHMLVTRRIALCKKYEQLPLQMIKIMFDQIEYHCECMNPGFETREDILIGLQSLDLSKYMSRSNDSSLWWTEMRPVLGFVVWFKQRLKDKIIPTNQPFKSFKMAVNAYWSKLSPEAQIHMEVLLRTPSLYQYTSLRHPIFLKYLQELNIGMFDAILTRNRSDKSSLNLHFGEDNAYTELAIWLLNNWNYEEKDEFEYGCLPFIRGHDEFAALLIGVLDKASPNKDLQVLLRTSRQFLLSSDTMLSRTVYPELFAQVAMKYLLRTNTFDADESIVPISTKISVHESGEQGSPAIHDGGSRSSDYSPRIGVFNAELGGRSASVLNIGGDEELAVPIFSVVHANKTSISSTQLVDSDDSTNNPPATGYIHDDVLASAEAGAYNDAIRSGASGAREETQEIQLEYHFRSSPGDACTVNWQEDGMTAEDFGDALVQLLSVAQDDDHATGEETVAQSAASDADTMPGPLAKADANPQAIAVSQNPGQGGTFSEISERPSVETASQEQNTLAVVPTSTAGSSRADSSAAVRKAVRSEPTADDPQSSGLAAQSDRVVGIDAGTRDTKITGPSAARLPKGSPNDAMTRMLSIQSVAREETSTDLQRTEPTAMAPNVEPAAIASKGSKLARKKGAEEAAKKPQKVIKFLQNAGQFLKTLGCCR